MHQIKLEYFDELRLDGISPEFSPSIHFLSYSVFWFAIN